VPKLPSVSGPHLIRLLESLGYAVVRQRGSHVQLRAATRVGEHKITVPVHKAIAKGTLNDILAGVSLWTGVPKADLIRRLGRK
jgi:predicted RNA binding protein YcfA (HicA-like mRNA interferase family)